MRFVIENLVHLVLMSSPLCFTCFGWGVWVIAWFFWVKSQVLVSQMGTKHVHMG